MTEEEYTSMWKLTADKSAVPFLPSFCDEDFDSVVTECLKVLKVKGEDYTIGTGDRLHNFKSVAEFTGMTPEQVLGVYFYKHVSAIFAYIKNGKQSESEPIEGRITDVVNYMLLFNKMVQERKRGNLK